MSRLVLLTLVAGCGGAAVTPAEVPEEDEEPAPPVVAIALRFEEAPTDEATGTPFTRVALVGISEEEGRTRAEVGTFEGVCQHVAASAASVLEARCWWAGFGAHITVRRKGDELIASRARYDEETPPAEPEEVARLALPAGAELDLILPASLAQ